MAAILELLENKKDNEIIEKLTNTYLKVQELQMIFEKDYKKFFDVLHLCSSLSSSSPIAELNLAKVYIYSIGYHLDKRPELIKKGLSILEKHVRWGDPEALYFYGLCLLNGQGIKKDQKKAIEYFEKALPHPAALTQLGSCYLTGDGVARDPKKAFELLSKAKDLGFADAHYFLGSYYSLAQNNSECDMKKAAECDQAGVELNVSMSMYSLAKLYENGYASAGIEKNEAVAYQLYERAARLFRREAQLKLIQAYTEGRYFPIDYEKAYYWYKKLIFQDPTQLAGLVLLANKLIEKHPNDLAKHTLAKTMLEYAENLGYERAIFPLAKLHEDGIGTKINLSEALKLYQKLIGLEHYPDIVDDIARVIGKIENEENAEKDTDKKDNSDSKTRNEDQPNEDPIKNGNKDNNTISEDPVKKDSPDKKTLFELLEFGNKNNPNNTDSHSLSEEVLTMLSNQHLKTSELMMILAKSDKYHQELITRAKTAHFAALNLAKVNIWCMGGEKDKKRIADGISMLTDLLKTEEPNALFIYAICLLEGKGIEKDLEKAIEYIKKTQSVPTAVRQLGACTMEGYGVDKDLNEAFKLLTKAAELGDAEAWYYLGNYYTADQDNHSVDMKKAVQCYEEGAKRGSALSMMRLAKFYINGNELAGIKKNVDLAYKLYQQAAALNDSNAQIFLIDAYSYGVPLPLDYEQAFFWYKKLLFQRPDLADHLAKLANKLHKDFSVLSRELILAREMLEYAIKFENVLALRSLAEHLIFGKKFKKDLPLAKDLLKRIISKDHKDHDAIHLLGCCSAEEKDFKEAFKLYQQAGDRGNKLAIYNLARLNEGGLGTELNLTKALELYLMLKGDEEFPYIGGDIERVLKKQEQEEKAKKDKIAGKGVNKVLTSGALDGLDAFSDKIKMLTASSLPGGQYLLNGYTLEQQGLLDEAEIQYLQAFNGLGVVVSLAEERLSFIHAKRESFKNSGALDSSNNGANAGALGSSNGNNGNSASASDTPNWKSHQCNWGESKYPGEKDKIASAAVSAATSTNANGSLANSAAVSNAGVPSADTNSPGVPSAATNSPGVPSTATNNAGVNSSIINSPGTNNGAADTSARNSSNPQSSKPFLPSLVGLALGSNPSPSGLTNNLSTLGTTNTPSDTSIIDLSKSKIYNPEGP